jgi:hypothetical protein
MSAPELRSNQMRCVTYVVGAREFSVNRFTFGQMLTVA